MNIKRQNIITRGKFSAEPFRHRYRNTLHTRLFRPLPAQVPADKTEGFSEALLAWYDTNRRDLPWRGTTDLYEIWVSEVMLQQTRVEYVRTYYEQFLDTFPTLEKLAAANLDDVLCIWEGLGYYARARNLHAAAQEVVTSGQLPADSRELCALPGLGPYSSRAIASIAFGEPVAAVDGNVRRVISRLFAHSGHPAKSTQSLADTLLCTVRPGDYNQAMMELGAQVCTSRRPGCSICPVQVWCLAWFEGTPELYPTPKKKGPIPHYHVSVAVLRDPCGRIFIQKRAPHGLLGGLWELPGGKAEDGESSPDTCLRELREELGVDVEVGRVLGTVEHAYSHFRITLRAHACKVIAGKPVSSEGLPTKWVPPDELHKYAFPRANRRILDLLVEPL